MLTQVAFTVRVVSTSRHQQLPSPGRWPSAHIPASCVEYQVPFSTLASAPVHWKATMPLEPPWPPPPLGMHSWKISICSSCWVHDCSSVRACSWTQNMQTCWWPASLPQAEVTAALHLAETGVLGRAPWPIVSAISSRPTESSVMASQLQLLREHADAKELAYVGSSYQQRPPCELWCV